MTVEEALGAVLLSLIGVAIAGWYVWCWFVMLFRCQSIRAYFSQAHSSSSLFALANVILFICGATWLLHVATGGAG